LDSSSVVRVGVHQARWQNMEVVGLTTCPAESHS
jgi:hypothetical protein